MIALFWPSEAEEDGSIRPYSENPWYWEYQGEPILLRGASDDDNFLRWIGEELTDHLDLLVSVVGNYIRNTMSDRETGSANAMANIGKQYVVYFPHGRFMVNATVWKAMSVPRVWSSC